MHPDATSHPVNVSVPSPARPSSAPLPAFPTGAWRGVLGAYRDLVAHTGEASTSFIWAAAAASLSVLLAPGVALAWGPETMRPLVFNLLLGSTGRSRKTTAISDAVRLLVEPFTPPPRYPGEPLLLSTLSGFASGEGLTEALADQDTWPPPKKRGVDAPERVVGRRALLVFDEFGAQLAKAGKDAAGNFIGVLLRLWDAPDRIQLSTRKAQLQATRPHVSILAASTYSYMGRALSPELVRDGLLNRFLLVHGEAGEPLPVRPPIDRAAHEQLKASITAAAQAVWGTPFVLDAEARALHAARYGVEHHRQHDSELLEDATGRAAAQAVRLALLFAAARGSTTVDQGDVAAAWEVVDYSRAVASHLLQHLEDRTWRDAEARVIARARKVAETYAGTFSRQEVRAGLKGGNGLDARTFSAAFDSLVRAGDIVRVEDTDRYRMADAPEAA